ncbi:hypothetical protein [Pinibacter aurantiacus]|uniref:Uncharacterized protein n=1 Tax=Pinibacter aurantiacus TaxID=2851599 RepID=A0A9E2SBF3_9BACT|nr:hypothetical protein [Pinibacter aurantiacus]MBV4359037.1 hypothetical protein [Pinibacter aurantiacus]
MKSTLNVPAREIAGKFMFAVLVVVNFQQIKAQVASSNDLSIEGISNKSLSVIDEKYSSLNNRINKFLANELCKQQRLESRLQRKLAKKDSTAAYQTFAKSQQELERLKQLVNNPLNGKRISNYIPKLDSLQTASKFLTQGNLINSTQIDNVKRVSGDLQKLEGNFYSAEQIEAYLKQRKELLTAQLEKFGMTKEIANLKNQAYYYRQQIEEYKGIFNDQQKLEEKALSTLRQLPAFQKFLQHNSYLSELFPSPSGGSVGEASANSIPGLQTRTQVQQLLQERAGSALSTPSNATNAVANPLQQNISAAQGQVDQLRNKLSNIGNSSNIE